MPGASIDRQVKQLEDRIRGLELRTANVPARWTPPSFLGGGYWALISGASLTSDNRWHYDFDQADLDNTDVWVIRSNGRIGRVADGTYALDGREMLNSGSGVQGNGVTVETLNSGMGIVPSVVGYPVWMRDVRKPDGSIRPIFNDPNGVDGACV